MLLECFDIFFTGKRDITVHRISTVYLYWGETNATMFFTLYLGISLQIRHQLEARLKFF